MSYQDIVSMAENRDLWMRLVACAAQEQPDDPIQWVETHVFKLCAQPSWDTAWASAAANNVESPGKDASVITDAMILSGTQAVLGIVAQQVQQQQAEVQAQTDADHQRTLEITRAAATGTVTE